MSAPAREATGDYSKRNEPSRERRDAVARPPIALLLTAAAGAVLLAVSELLPLYEVVIGGLETRARTEAGWESHAFAMLVLSLATIPMLLGAGRGARPAMAAIAAIGVVAIVIVLTVDLPQIRADAELREATAYEDVRAKAAIGFYVETLGAVLLLISGGLMALAPRRKARPRERPPRED